MKCRELKVGNKFSKGYVESIINSMTREVKSNILDGNSQIQKVQEDSGSKILRINNAISVLETKIRAGMANNNIIAVQKRTVARTTTAGQTENIKGRLASDTGSQILTGMNEVNIC